MTLRETPPFRDDFAFLAEAVDPGVTAKLTIPSPSMVHYRGVRAAIDPGEDEFWGNLSAAYAVRVRRVAELGCRYLQLDATGLACSATTRPDAVHGDGRADHGDHGAGQQHAGGAPGDHRHGQQPPRDAAHDRGGGHHAA
jgi:methionine synthase II (cobalamin-independent)